MEIPFVKYQGTGNDFILIDGREELPPLDVKFWCDRKFGIGADGLMILAKSNQIDIDFEMIYYNSDGNLSSMCGNGGRCIAHWANSLGIGTQEYLRFLAPDGVHEAWIQNEEVKLSMNSVTHIEKLQNGDFTLNTGSPHYVKQHSQIPDTFVSDALAIRLSSPYRKEGINVNFYQALKPSVLECRTFERGVEDETLSCGTGVTAVALTHAEITGMSHGKLSVNTRGGNLIIHFEKSVGGTFENIFLEGPVKFVFKGILDSLAGFKS
jgi:diaminopimelate epimerase